VFKNMLDIAHLTKIYGRGNTAVRAVDDISVRVPSGTFFGLLGPNGAGKSTTIGCVTGTHTITSGTITVAGYDVVADYRSARRSIGFSAQEFNVNPFESVYHLIDFMGGYYGMPRAARRERMAALLEELQLAQHQEKQFRELSGGLKRRVVLARALIHEPPLLILDEPTAGIDVEQRRDIWKHLARLNDAGTTIIFTSHYLEEVERLCDRVAIINHGKIVADDTLQAYKTRGRSLEDEYLAITSAKDTTVTS
jgi:ABC-2 type transport system ATP-binding protein